MDGQALPFQILNGAAGYINLLDAFSSWQLVRELKAATGLPSADSFKHVSPAGAEVTKPLTAADRQVCFVPEGLELSAIAQADVRARGCDRVSSFGDFAALSDECDASVAQFLVKEVSEMCIRDRVAALGTAGFCGADALLNLRRYFPGEQLVNGDVQGLSLIHI